MRRGVFAVSYCGACTRWVWPHSPRCNRCYGATSIRPYSERGVVLGYSSRDGVVFGVCEFPGGIRIMGRLTGGPCSVHQHVVISGCGTNGDVPFFEFT